ncbi:hypothetical protein QEZ54_32215 [Catellatospora sp. KI3]|uniref:hypothetical protein n=1 Tax=Catellatospora sp. KI3 TaxID=3041620 RepID=UPI0024826796|nr:hypothetical protein [Catellatospora sp. KI3]MDI1465646.1 hypothetical protein [Catellatospora sp. KI3]
MTGLWWRDGVQELRRFVSAEGGEPDRVHDVDLAWRAFQAFLHVPLLGLYDRWHNEVEADTLVIEFGESGCPDDDRPGLLLARRFAIPAVEWVDGEPMESSQDEPADRDTGHYAADFVQIELELFFPPDVLAHADDLWTAADSGRFAAAALAEADELVRALRLGPASHSHLHLTACN